MSRYTNKRKIVNASEYYAPLRRSRGLRAIVQYETLMLHNPTVSQRTSLKTNTHIWKYGDRYYKLANQYYGDPKLWWAIAWYNEKPTEGHVEPGSVLFIPMPVGKVLSYFNFGAV